MKNVHVDASEENGDLVFLHKVLPGPADKSYGIHVAKLAGLPDEVLTSASKILSGLEGNSVHTTLSESIHEPAAQIQAQPSVTPVEDETQLSLFPEEKPVKKESKKENQVIKELTSQDLMSVTPIEAINLLYKWQKKLK